ncbi:MAG: histidinol-phosphate transaminase [Bacteroidales bacterium]|nr:histidinol-phosphate transaminase [Bacteroidales bacterium]MBN2821010.1 histidinol-phosphate transaminase [Bacteroidales bacterium]
MFNLQEKLRKNIRDLEPYSSARDEFQGIASVYLDANENPFNNGINRYPDPLQEELKTKIKSIKKVHPEQIFLGNGSDEAIDLLIRAFCEPGEDNIVSIKPTYGMYKVCADINHVEYREAPLKSGFNIDIPALLSLIDNKTKLLFLCSPNNPTGNCLAQTDIIRILDLFNGILIIDEAYIDFAPGKSLVPLINSYPNLVVLQTFSKAWGMAGIRLGMAFGTRNIIEVLNRIKYPYNINVLTQQKAAEQLMQEEEKNKQVDTIIKERENLVLNLNKLDFVEEMYRSDANFVLVKVKDAKATYNYLLEKGIIVRDRSRVALCENSLRITVGTEEENKALINELTNYKPV